MTQLHHLHRQNRTSEIFLIENHSPIKDKRLIKVCHIICAERFAIFRNYAANNQQKDTIDHLCLKKEVLTARPNLVKFTKELLTVV